MKTDEQIDHDVTDKLARDPSVDASNIALQVSGGVVKRVGRVENHVQRWAAHRAAQRVESVRGLSIEMPVSQISAAHQLDAEMARHARALLNHLSFLPEGSVVVTVLDGCLTSPD